MPMGVMHHKTRIFITLPRRRPGMPATLTFVAAGGARGSSPSLQAYPNFRTNELHVSNRKDSIKSKRSNLSVDLSFQPQNQPDRNRIVSVYRSRVDACNRLWFVDTGALEYPNNRIQVQPPSIWLVRRTKKK